MKIRIKSSGHEQIISKEVYDSMSDRQKSNIQIIPTSKPKIVEDIEANMEEVVKTKKKKNNK